jgi:hypothetical protein
MMGMASMHEAQAKIAELRMAYVASLPDLLAQFEAGVRHLRDGMEECRDGLRAIAHRLGGTGALYGADALTVWGKETERMARNAAPELLEAAAEDLRAIIGSLR